MSDYKIVNGKKVRVCKYGCFAELVSSDEKVTSQQPNSNVSKFKISVTVLVIKVTIAVLSLGMTLKEYFRK